MAQPCLMFAVGQGDMRDRGPKTMGELLALLAMVVGGVLAIAFYFAPTIHAYFRRHHNAAAIMLLNIFLGWTFLGWVIAAVWSCTATYRR